MINEIRIGNVVIVNGEVVKVDLEFFQNYNDKLKLEGLKLSKKMLIDLNWYEQKNYEWSNEGIEVEVDPYYFSRQIPYEAAIRMPGIFIRFGLFYILGGYIGPEVKYVHQLQNIFYIKTGVEMLIPDIILNCGAKNINKEPVQALVDNTVKDWRDKLVIDFIPHIEKLIEKETAHIDMLRSRNAPSEMISRSEFYLNHYKSRHKEFTDYVKTLS